jgi:hypothetical protein
MSELADEIRALIDRSTERERTLILDYLRQRLPLHPLEEEWGTTAEAILTAIARSSDLTQRGIRGILAEATLKRSLFQSSNRPGGEQARSRVISRMIFC